MQAKGVADSVTLTTCRCFRRSCRRNGAVWRSGIWGVERLDLEVVRRGVDGEPEGATQPGVSLHFSWIARDRLRRMMRMLARSRLRRNVRLSPL